MQFLNKKCKKKILAVNFFQFLFIKTLDLDPDPDPMRILDTVFCSFLQIFWERRYKELQQQGLNPENHDFQVHIQSCTVLIFLP